ncbi:peptidylprolyl isomerase [Clostridium cylindrosporum]|uniref:peptidylprolyl isomerase n=1 Tax=Clostridium cylindrosporum DSM 605 TaxID=1121307 RepID=A0A0J8D7P4_CLOCY|nr:peptidylprolyl isomerase [Clostridium cylindrosporum]KMT22055.1 foldase protein PrsA [Clostridium cylindrosporum DSM 605]
MKKLKVAVGLVVAAMFAFTGCAQLTKTEQGKNKSAVATVYGEDITKGEFDKRFAPILKNIEHQYKKQADSDAKLKKEGKKVDTADQNRLPADKANFIKTQKDQYLKDLTQEKIYFYNAKKKKIEVKSDEINKELKAMVDNGIKQYGSKEKFEAKVLEETGLTYKEYESFVKDSLKIQLTQQKLQEAIAKTAKVTDKEAKDEYDKNPYKYTEKPNKIYFAHILVEKKEDADKIKKQLDAGGNMADLAKKYSTDPGSKDKGGEYKEGLEYSNLDPAFLEAALKLKPEQISAPVKGQYGYYIIKLHKKEEYPKKPFDKVKEEIEQTLLQTKQMTVVQTETASWEKPAKVKTYPENL